MQQLKRGLVMNGTGLQSRKTPRQWDISSDSYQKNCPYIYKWYRPVAANYYKCILSICYIHNETFNIWSHLIGTLMMVGAAAYYKKCVTPNAHFQTAFVYFYFICAGLCMAFSAIFHIFMCHSEAVKQALNK